jgi:hypothetical protein
VGERGRKWKGAVGMLRQVGRLEGATCRSVISFAAVPVPISQASDAVCHEKPRV